VKRSPELAPLSRDHQPALEIALALKRTNGDDLEQTAARYTAFMAGDGAAHFDEEEAVLVPALPGELAERLVREHANLRDATLGDVAAARRTGELLAAHVRFEERVVFTHLEETLPPDDLAAIGRRLAAG
jgi:hypothetical protein